MQVEHILAQLRSACRLRTSRKSEQDGSKRGGTVATDILGLARLFLTYMKQRMVDASFENGRERQIFKFRQNLVPQKSTEITFAYILVKSPLLP